MGQNKDSKTDRGVEVVKDSGRPSYEDMRARILDIVDDFFRDFFRMDDVSPAKIAKDVSLNTWHGCMSYVNYQYVGKIDKMQATKYPGQGRGILTNKHFDLDIIEDLANIYVELCQAYDKPQSAVAFADLAGMSNQILTYWGSDKRQDNVTSRRYKIFKKIQGARNEAIKNRVLDGGARTLGAVTMYNNEVLPGASRSDSGGMIAGDSLPRLGLPDGSID